MNIVDLVMNIVDLVMNIVVLIMNIVDLALNGNNALTLSRHDIIRFVVFIQRNSQFP